MLIFYNLFFYFTNLSIETASEPHPPPLFRSAREVSIYNILHNFLKSILVLLNDLCSAESADSIFDSDVYLCI